MAATMHRFFKSEFFNFEFLRLIAMTAHEGAEIGEALEAAAKICDGDAESWYQAFLDAGSVAEQIGTESERAGDRIGARRGFLRASNYLRAAQFMLNEGPLGRDARVLPTLERSIALFRRGISYRDGKTVLLEIPYDGGRCLPGYLYLPPETKRLRGRKTPVLVNSGGGDSTQEEIYFINAAYGPDVGYAVVTFEGPGQGIVLRRDKLPMRPDWEHVAGCVLDHLHRVARQRPELGLDLDHVAIAGASMGGYFALRAAADARFSACVSVDGFYDLGTYAGGRMPPPLYAAFGRGWLPDWLFDTMLSLLQAVSFQARWEFNHMRWVTGERSEAAIMRAVRPYTLRESAGGEFLARVQCPTLVTGAAASWYYDPATTTDRVYAALQPAGGKEKWVAGDVARGGLQAKVGAFGYSAQRTFSWLDKVWGIEREALC